jgi:hypothetical protein
MIKVLGKMIFKVLVNSKFYKKNQSSTSRDSLGSVMTWCLAKRHLINMLRRINKEQGNE